MIENPTKVSEYIYVSRVGIKILPPDINRGVSGFSVDEGNIRYGLAAISIGKPVIEAIVSEREEMDCTGTERFY
ncbi:MAG: hypothetical protein ACLSXO_03725 [Coprococcus sp.]